MAFRPLQAPPDGGEIGWRVEFRPMEVQMTDFENAAFVVFMALVRRAISHFDLNFYLPMELVGDNMRRSVMRDAVNQNQSWFTESALPEGDSRGSSPSDSGCSNPGKGYREMWLREIMCGGSEGSSNPSWDSPLKGAAPFPGLRPPGSLVARCRQRGCRNPSRSQWLLDICGQKGIWGALDNGEVYGTFHLGS